MTDHEDAVKALSAALSGEGFTDEYITQVRSCPSAVDRLIGFMKKTQEPGGDVAYTALRGDSLHNPLRQQYILDLVAWRIEAQRRKGAVEGLAWFLALSPSAQADVLETLEIAYVLRLPLAGKANYGDDAEIVQQSVWGRNAALILQD